MTVYSPTQTQTWQDCPVKWALSREGWQPKYLGHVDVARIRGVAFHAGAMDLHMMRGRDPIMGARWTIEKLLDEMVANGQQWLPDVPGIEPDDTLVRSALEQYAAHPLWQSWDIQDVELAMPEWGNTRIDVGIKQADGYAVVDLKYKRSVKPRYNRQPQHEADADELAEYLDDAKMMHHCWAYDQHLGRNGIGMLVTAYWIVIVVSEPKFRVLAREFPVTRARMDAWHVSARRKWHMMDMQRESVFGLWEGPHVTRYGLCPFAEACLEWGRDPVLMERAFVKVPR